MGYRRLCSPAWLGCLGQGLCLESGFCSPLNNSCWPVEHGTAVLFQRIRGAQGTRLGSRVGILLVASPSHPFPVASKRDCLERFGPRTLERITQDDDVICTTEYSRIVPLENGEVGCTAMLAWGWRVPVAAWPHLSCHPQIVVSLVNGRPGAMNFSYSPLLRDFTKATNIRLRFLRTNTLLGHLMGKALRDPTVTRRVSLWVW